MRCIIYQGKGRMATILSYAFLHPLPCEMVRNHQATLISLGLGRGNKKEIERTMI